MCAHIETGFIYILLYTSFACVRNLKIRRETKKQRDANKLSQCFDKVNLRRRRVVAPVFRAQLRHVGCVSLAYTHKLCPCSAGKYGG